MFILLKIEKRLSVQFHLGFGFHVAAGHKRCFVFWC
jgi:hypothetical protein